LGGCAGGNRDVGCCDPIARKIEGTPDQQLATQTKRLEIREILGSKNMREITLK